MKTEKKSREHDTPHEIEPTRMYVLNGVPFLPSYTAAGFYISPGSHSTLANPMGTHTTLTKAALIDAGATEKIMSLWPRPKYRKGAV